MKVIAIYNCNGNNIKIENKWMNKYGHRSQIGASKDKRSRFTEPHQHKKQKNKRNEKMNIDQHIFSNGGSRVCPFARICDSWGTMPAKRYEAKRTGKSKKIETKKKNKTER